MLQLGITVRDRITGFAGVITGRCEYISGCNQVLVIPPAKSDGSMGDGVWLDEQRVERVGDSLVVLDNGRTPGPDKPAPIR